MITNFKGEIRIELTESRAKVKYINLMVIN
jgi:hypothetical protein